MTPPSSSCEETADESTRLLEDGCGDCTPVPVAAVALDWSGTRPATPGGVVVHGRLGVGFARDGDGTESFLRLTDARVTPLLRARS
jgi:hypothetical protein